MSSSDQHLLDELYRNLTNEPNGNGRPSKANVVSEKTDEEIIDLCRKAKNAAKFAALFDDGDLSEHEGDDSVADAALLGIMAFYTQDRTQLDRLFRRSALMRQKWERVDYRDRTLDYVLSNTTETYHGGDKSRQKAAKVIPSTNPLGAIGVSVDAASGGELLDKLVEYLRRFVVLSEDEARTMALWIVHTYAFEAAETTPYLHIKSAEKRSGKSRLLEALEQVVNAPWLTGRATPAVLVRKVADQRPTLLLDESDAAFKASQEYTETLRGVLNAGFRQGGAASLCVGQGANITYQDFPVYSPKAIAGIGSLPDTVADRSIPINLKRRKRGEEIERFRRRKVASEAAPLRERVAAWVETVGIEAFAGREVNLPDALDDRAQDIVEPLLAIADVVGGEWPERARSAVVELLTGEERDDQESLGVRLLADIRSVFAGETMRSSFIVAELRKMGETGVAPWDEYKVSGLTPQRMAQLLKPYGIKSKKVWDKTVEKPYQGFERAQFEDAWARYLPEHEQEDEETEEHERSDGTDEDFDTITWIH